MDRRTLNFMLCALLSLFWGCRVFLTSSPEDAQVLDAPLDGLTGAQLRAFFAGDKAFAETFSVEQGLGPVFNQTACNSCHPRAGRGHPATNVTRFGKISGNTFDTMVELGGPHLQERAIPGYPAETLPQAATGISVRGGPMIVGLGLIEAIPDDSILVNEDADDLNNDGISGRANFVPAPDYLQLAADKVLRDGKYLGRFGRKAGAINLLHQTVNDYKNNMGITTTFDPVDVFNPVMGARVGDSVPDPELPVETVQNVVFYLQTLRPPIRRNVLASNVSAGETLFAQIGCAGCHIPAMQTGASQIAALSFKKVMLYSDLLLHDMGPALADDYPEGDASGTEWRTAPLWGLGIVENLLGGIPFYLHDGRTSDLREVIALHQGEADSSRVAFEALAAGDQKSLLAFLKSL